MITPRDPEYAEAREYKEGRRQMVAPFADIADWIAQVFAVERPLQIRLDRPGKRIPPDFNAGSRKFRLEVIFDYEDQAAKFRDKKSANFDEQKRRRIGEKLLETLEEYPAKSGSTLRRILPMIPRHIPTSAALKKAGWFVVFSSFEYVARQEANSAIAASEIEDLEAQLAPLGIWKVFRLFAGVTFMFETDAQAEAAAGNGTYENCRNAYWTLLQPHDRYGYFARTPIWDRCDSRETFERDYKGSWQYYMR